MKKFVLNTSLFGVSIFLILTTTMLVVNGLVDNSDYFRLEKDYKYAIFGHSHSECAYNDSLIQGFKNLSSSGEAYYYTYHKIRKILESNDSVKTIFVEYTNDQIQPGMDVWTWGDEYMYRHYPRYAAFIGFEDIGVLLSNNWRSTLNLQSRSFKNNILFLAMNRRSYVEALGWGRYLYLSRDKTDSLLNVINDRGVISKEDQDTSATNIQYLKKIIDVCSENNVSVYLIRSPIHKANPLLNEPKFRVILNQHFPEVTFLDFKDFPLDNDQFGDLEHLNHKGARIFSLFFAELIKKGLLTEPNKQAVIDAAIESKTIVSEHTSG